MCGHFLFLFFVSNKPNLGSLFKFVMEVMYDSSCFGAIAGATELLGVSVPEKLKSATDNFVYDSLVNNSMKDYVAVDEADMMT